MWKIIKVHNDVFFTNFKIDDDMAHFILYDIAKMDAYAEVSSVEHLLHRAQKINPEAPFDINLPLIIPTLIQNDPTIVNIETREVSSPYLSLSVNYPIQNFNIGFHWHLRPINISQFQQLIMDPCLSMLREMYMQMSNMMTALNRNHDRLKLYQCQHCQRCGHLNNYSDAVSRFEDKQLDELNVEFKRTKYMAKSFLMLDFYFNQYRQLKTTESSTSIISACSNSSFGSSISEVFSDTTIISMGDSNKSVVADKGNDKQEDKPVIQVFQKMNDFREESSEVCLEPSIIAKTDRTKDAKTFVKDQKDHMEPISTSDMKNCASSYKLKTLFEAPCKSSFEHYNSSGRSSDESNTDENQTLTLAEIAAIKKLPTVIKAPIKQGSVNRSKNQIATRAAAREIHPMVEKRPRFDWILNKSTGILEYQPIFDSEHNEEAKRQQYLRDRDRRWRLFEQNRPIKSDEYVAAGSAHFQSFGEIIDSFERLVETRICTLNNSCIPCTEEDRPMPSERCKESARPRRFEEAKTVSFCSNDNEVIDLSAQSSARTLCECSSNESILQSFVGSQGEISDTEPVASTSSQ